MKQSPRRNGHMTGMRGVYLTAAELTKGGLIVSPTSRSSFGADLLVTDANCKKAWSVQVKTNHGRPNFWLLNKHSKRTASPSHIYVLVNLCQQNATQVKRHPLPDYYVVRSGFVAKHLRTTRRRTGTVFYWISLHDIEKYKAGWSIFGRAWTPAP
jgi:hypothetical protein